MKSHLYHIIVDHVQEAPEQWCCKVINANTGLVVSWVYGKSEEEASRIAMHWTTQLPGPIKDDGERDPLQGQDDGMDAGKAFLASHGVALPEWPS